MEISVDKLLVYGWFVSTVLQTFAYTPAQGALTTLFALTNPVVKKDAKKYNGKYLEPFDKVTPPSAIGADIAVARKLWELSEEFVAKSI